MIDCYLLFPGLPGFGGHIVYPPRRPVRAVCHCCGQPQRSDGFHNLCHRTGGSLHPHLGHVHLPSHIEVPILAILSNVTFYQFSFYKCFCYCNSCNTNICICSEVERKKLLGQLKKSIIKHCYCIDFDFIKNLYNRQHIFLAFWIACTCSKFCAILSILFTS